MTDGPPELAALGLDDKAALTAGADLWSTVEIAHAGIGKVLLTDGPNGARGPNLGSVGASSSCVPCGSALGATWNPELLERVGSMLGRQARERGCRVLLAPTVNIHRSPLAGRNFECYSEDPLLSGRMAAAFVRGVQREGVIATVKHFVGNEAEFERNSMSSVIDERALREIYLLPFEMAVKEGGALGIMTAYNRVNGSWCSEDPRLLREILRDEWGFEGIVMTDWFAVADTVRSAVAGVDLEMPGPGRAYGRALARAVRSGDLDEGVLDEMVGRLLATFSRVGAFDEAGDATDVPAERPEERALAREAASEAMVLLRNDGILPLDPRALRTVAVVGPNAGACQIMGGGSAQVRPHRLLSPIDMIRDAFGDAVAVAYEPGCELEGGAHALRVSGGPTLEFFSGWEWQGDPVWRATAIDLRLMFVGAPAEAVPASWSMRARGQFVPEVTGTHELTLSQCGRARVLVDGVVVLDGFREPPPPGGQDFFGFGSTEAVAPLDLRSGIPVDVVVEYASREAAGIFGVKVGCRLPRPADRLERAVAAAAGADVAIVIVGTSDDVETEGRDRASMDLPGAQDQLIRAVAAANHRTVVVVNSGSPVAMDWADDVAAVVQAWFGGQEMATALADVLIGVVEPGGRLPTTIPIRVEHSPSHGNFPGENGEVRYGESVFVGYRGYEHRALPVRFPFGHGTGYTTFVFGSPEHATPALRAGETFVLDVPVTNVGTRRGATVVQCYVAPIGSRLARPPKELKAFVKVRAMPGETVLARLELGPRAFSYWDPGQPDWPSVDGRVDAAQVLGMTPASERRAPGWYADPGRYEIQVGYSSTDIAHRVEIDLTP